MILGNLASALTSAGVSGNAFTSIFSSVAGSLLGTVASQVKADLTQLAALLNNPTAFAMASPAIITKIESINGLSPTVFPLLEKLRTSTDPLVVAQTISEIEAMV